ncbi:hypothetical protein LWO97_004403 [Salmonella enterica subsp. enterica serovar Enteritidis]|nr:hypothetical protein [Salmonella enterica]EIR2646760.1 hypothetical protein [Salmonella enterica subsp. enterica serovar Enteritidis]
MKFSEQLTVSIDISDNNDYQVIVHLPNAKTSKTLFESMDFFTVYHWEQGLEFTLKSLNKPVLIHECERYEKMKRHYKSSNKLPSMSEFK